MTGNSKRRPPSGSPEVQEWASSTAKSPDDFPAIEEPMTEEQASRLRSLCERVGEPFDPSLSEEEASERIEQLEEKLR